VGSRQRRQPSLGIRIVHVRWRQPRGPPFGGRSDRPSAVVVLEAAQREARGNPGRRSAVAEREGGGEQPSERVRSLASAKAVVRTVHQWKEDLPDGEIRHPWLGGRGGTSGGGRAVAASERVDSNEH